MVADRQKITDEVFIELTPGGPRSLGEWQTVEDVVVEDEKDRQQKFEPDEHENVWVDKP